MPSSPSTLGWSKFCISADLAMKSSISLCDETSVETLYCGLNGNKVDTSPSYLQIMCLNVYDVSMHPHNVNEVVL